MSQYSEYPEEEEEEDMEQEEDPEEYSDEGDNSMQDDEEQGYEDETEDMVDEDAEHDDEDMDDYQSEFAASRMSARGYNQSRRSDLLLSTPGALTRSRQGGMMDTDEPMSASKAGGKVLKFQAIAKDLYNEMEVPPVDESDDLVLNTEITIARLYAEGIGATDEEDTLHEALNIIPGELIKLWEDYYKNTTPYNSEEYFSTIGPGPQASDFAKANFIASLALRIHHPPKLTRTLGSFDHKVTPLPQILLGWMDEHHRPYVSQVEEIQTHRPSPANHPLFWDTIFNSLLRGKILAVINILKDAGWRHARNETDDLKSQSQYGFSGVALSNIERVIHAVVEVLGQCPAVHGDWNIRSSDWQLFRLKIAQSLGALKTFAEGNSKDRHADDFGESMGDSTYGMRARKAESQVPWHIYQNLVTLYSLMIGDKSAIIETSQDWLEATVGLLVWWDESKDDRRLALGKSQTFRVNKESDEESYIRKLRKSFNAVTNTSPDFQVNSADEVQVALASVFDGDNESVIGFLRGWSGPVSSAVAEVASLGGWLPRAEEKSLITMEGFEQEDFETLGLGTSSSKSEGVKDMTLTAYAGSLSQRGQLRSSSRPQIIREGWELAIAVLGRLDSTSRSEEMVGDFLGNFALESSNTVDKLWRLLNDLGMGRHAEDTAESYADYLAEGSHRYGEALWYYALAHKGQKVKDVLDLLISFSLIQSTAYPSEAELDDHLKNLISSPGTTLTEMSQMDLEAAELLKKSLSGYATLRRFYDIRDEEIASNSQKPRRGAYARKSEAANALMAVIISSDDNIRGGLYDEDRDAVVSVDFLLALLGEAMVFINQPDYTATVSQINILLKAIEDVQAVGPRVYSACTEFLQTVVASGQGLKGSSPTDMLRKTNSNISGTSGSFSMVGSSMLASQLKQSMSSSGVMVKGNVKRGWDWRRGISAGTSGEDLLRILRLGLAKDLAKAWVMEADNKM